LSQIWPVSSLHGLLRSLRGVSRAEALEEANAMTWIARTSVSIALAAALVAVGSSASAQEAGGTATVGGTLPPPKVTTRVETTPAGGAAKKEDDDPTSDHEKVVGHFGVGYLGVSDLPIAAAGGGIPARGSVSAPVIGVRYWLNEKLGLDLGLGFAMSTGSTELAPAGAASTTTDLGSRFGLALHGGVPLVFAHQKHFTFLLIPELNVGFTNQSNETGQGAATVKTTLSGFRLDLGARIGSEIHFGFIGIPQLALQATVGAYVKREAWKATSEVSGNSSSASQGATAFGTSVQSDPWALFTNNISAIYYLP
jgi:hypothetical protein